MENAQNLKHCPWISKEVNLEEYFSKYSLLVKSNNSKENDEKVDLATGVRNCFPACNVSPKDGNMFDPFNFNKLDNDCSISHLTVDGELRNEVFSGKEEINRWVANSFVDGFVPPHATEKLMTLKAQQSELHRRETIDCYAHYRNRLFKYISTVRVLDHGKTSDSEANDCSKEIIVSIRIQRPYHRKTHYKKSSNPYPTHNQELFMLGSQKLSELKDVITCVSDKAIHADFSSNPDANLITTFPTYKEEFPSSCFYINGTFYIDTRHNNAKDYSAIIRTWSKKHKVIGEMNVKDMQNARVNELILRFGYSYLYLHLGDCEHLITFTDARLFHQNDVSDISRYPLTAGYAIKKGEKCFACLINQPNWIVQKCKSLPNVNAFLCDSCLKSYCYDKNGVKLSDFRVFVYVNESQTQSSEKLKK